MKNASVVVILLAALIVPVPSVAQPSARAVEALDGVDPVLLVQRKDVSGKPQFTVTRGAFEYLFASAETMAVFQKDPARYEIQLNGLWARVRWSGGIAASPARRSLRQATGS